MLGRTPKVVPQRKVPSYSPNRTAKWFYIHQIPKRSAQKQGLYRYKQQPLEPRNSWFCEGLKDYQCHGPIFITIMVSFTSSRPQNDIGKYLDSKGILNSGSKPPKEVNRAITFRIILASRILRLSCTIYYIQYTMYYIPPTVS